MEDNDEAEYQVNECADCRQIPERKLHPKEIHHPLDFAEAQNQLQEPVDYSQGRENGEEPARFYHTEEPAQDSNNPDKEVLTLCSGFRFSPKISDDPQCAKHYQKQSGNLYQPGGKSGRIDKQQNTDSEQKNNNDQFPHVPSQ